MSRPFEGDGQALAAAPWREVDAGAGGPVMVCDGCRPDVAAELRSRCSVEVRVVGVGSMRGVRTGAGVLMVGTDTALVRTAKRRAEHSGGAGGDCPLIGSSTPDSATRRRWRACRPWSTAAAELERLAEQFLATAGDRFLAAYKAAIKRAR